jgi:hypothetical protein
LYFPSIGPTTIGVGKQVATNSILNPMLWLCGIVTPVSLAAAIFATGALVTIFAILAIAPPVIAMLAYAYFVFADPDRLQSEPFRIEQQWVQAQIGDNRTKEVITIPVEATTLSTNSAMLGGDEA